MGNTDYKCTVVYSVCGHNVSEWVYGEVEKEACRRSPINSSHLTLPRGMECRPGWCQMCWDYYRPDDIENATVIDNYWRFKAQQRWLQPVHPNQVPRSALFSRHESTLVRAASLDVAACLSSLFAHVHDSQPRLIHSEAATLIRESTLRWARRMERLNKALPATPGPEKHDEDSEITAPESVNTIKGGKKGRPTLLVSVEQAQQSLTFIDSDGERYWVPGAHRTPTTLTSQSVPLRTPLGLSRCGYHGRVDASRVDMACHQCRAVFLDESQVSPSSRLVKFGSAPAFSVEFYAYAAQGKCSCKLWKHEVCSPCKARAQVSERQELGYSFL